MNGERYIDIEKAKEDILIKHFLILAEIVYLHCGAAGGHCHIVLDDGNLRDSDIAFCIEIADKKECQLCRYTMQAFSKLTPKIREALWKYHDEVQFLW